MLRLLQMGPSKVLTTFFIQIQSSWQLSLLELPPCHNTVTPPPWTPPTRKPPLCNLAPPLLMLHSCPTLVSKALITHLPIIYLLPLPPTTIPCSWLSFCTSCLLSPLTLSGFFNGMLEVFKAGALNYFTFFHPILSTLSAFRNLILTLLPLSGFSALRSDGTHSQSGIPSSNTMHTSHGVVVFVRQGLSFSEFSTSSLSSLDPYSDYVGINISLNNSSLLSFLNVYAPLTAPLQRMAEPIPYLLQKFFHSGGLQLRSPLLGLKRYFRPLWGGSI